MHVRNFASESLLNDSGSNYVFSLTVMLLNCYVLINWTFPHVCLVFLARLCGSGRCFKSASLFARLEGRVERTGASSWHHPVSDL